MQNTKISIIALSILLFGNSLNCMSAPQKRVLKRGKSGGTLVSQSSTITVNTPGQVPIIPEIPFEDKDGDGNNDILQDDPISGDTPTTPGSTIVDIEKINRNNRIRKIRSEYRTHLNNAQLNCIGISRTLELVQGLSIGTTVVSGIGSLAAGGAMVSELVPDSTSEKNNDKERTILETGLLVGSSATSVAGIATSAISLSNMDDLLSKMKSCKSDISNIRNIKEQLIDEDVDETDSTISQINDITNNCGGIDDKSIENIEHIKGLLVASTVTSGVGAAGSIGATITNLNIKSSDTLNNISDEDKKKKAQQQNTGLKIATSIMTGIAGGAQGTSALFSGIVLGKINNDKDTADKCEDTLMKY